jgi:peptidyl-Asp metalloendopeptidase
MLSMHRAFLLCLLLLTGLSGLTSDAQAPAVAALFLPAAEDFAPAMQTPPGAMRERRAEVVASALAADRLRLDLFADTVLEADLVAREGNADGSVTWSGRVPEQPLSSVTFVQTGDIIQGSIRVWNTAYSVAPAGQSERQHVIREVNPHRSGEELVPLAQPISQLSAPNDTLLTGGDDGSTVDVLVVYTTAARVAAGGTDAAVRARIQLGVAETNLAYANSGIVQRLRLVGAEPIAYTESVNGISQDLERVTNNGDGFMDSVHGRRDQLGADLVSLIVDNSGGSCGVSWLMDTPTVSFAPLAFSVTVYDCISPNYTFGHELGHNMGAAHAPGDPNLVPAYPYAYGYKDPGGRFRTIMAYDCPGGCPRVLHFSSPNPTYAGRPTGTRERHNNARALNNTRRIVANFRQAVAPGLSAPRSFSVSTVGTTATFTWAPPSVGQPTAYVLEVGSAPGLADLAALYTNGPVTSFVTAAVPPGSYYVHVRAVNAGGPGSPSTNLFLQMTDQGRCIALPATPVLAVAAVTGSSVRLSWTAPSTGGAPVRHVVGAGYAPGALDAAVIDTASAATSVTLPAEPGRYFVRVAGVNPCGTGAPSNEIEVIVGPPPPGAPSTLSASISPTRVVTLTWAPPTSGGAPLSYALEAGTASGASDVGTEQTASPSTSFAVRATPGVYFVRVRGLNTAGPGPASAELQIVVP